MDEELDGSARKHKEKLDDAFGPSLAQRAHAWVVGRDTGCSSQAIWANMMGAGKPAYWGWFHPLDPADLGRCLRLLRLIPEWRERMPEMAQHSPEWAALVERWDDLAAMMEDEVGIDWSKGKSARRTYDAMNAVLDRPTPTPEPEHE